MPHGLVRRPAIVSAYLAPVLFIGGTIAAGLAWPAYNPVVQTISELAAGDAPTREFMTIVFMLTALCHLVTGVFTPGIGRPGRIALVCAGAATFAVAIFPLPSVAGTSIEHRTSAIIGFVILALWPVLGMRVRKLDGSHSHSHSHAHAPAQAPAQVQAPALAPATSPAWPWAVRPFGAILGTVLLGAACFWFLGVWSGSGSGYLGVVERVAADAESLWPAIVVSSLLIAERRATGIRTANN